MDSFPPKNNFKIYAAVGVFFAILCLFAAGVTIAVAAAVPPSYEPICIVGVSGMRPSIEIGLIESGVWTPNPKIIFQIGPSLPMPIEGMESDWLW